MNDGNERTAGLVIDAAGDGGGAAERVGRARGWAVERVTSAGAASEIVRASRDGTIVVVAGAGADADFFLRIAHDAATCSPRVSLGVVYGRTDGERMNAAARFDARRAPGRAGEQPFSGLASTTFRGARMVERDPGAGNDGALRLLGRPAEIGFLSGHSNGLDVDVGASVLCTRFDGVPVSDDELRHFPCARGAACARCRPDQANASPSLLRTRRLVLLSCWGVSLSPYVFAPEHTLGQAILRSPHVDVLLTTVRASRVDALDVPHLYYLANLGLPLGEVANRANRLRIARGSFADIVCFGDPESRVEASLDVADVERDEDGVYVVRGDDGAAKDVAIDVAGHAMPEEPIVLADGVKPVTGMCEPGRALFLTVPKGAGEVRLRAVDRRSFLPEAAMAELARDLDFARSYAREIAMKTESADATFAAAAVDVARDAIEKSPLLDVAQGSVVPVQAIEHVLDDLQTKLGTSAYRCIGAFIQGVRHLGTYHPYNLWNARYRLLGQRPAGRCAYCGSSCDEDTFRARSGDARRWVVACRGCGPIFDGDPSLGASLRVDDPARPGLLPVDLPMKNPYAIDVPAFGVAVVTSFTNRGDFALGEIRGADLAPGESKTMSVDVVIPETASTGVYYLCCGLAIGGRLQFFRRSLHVDARHRAA